MKSSIKANIVLLLTALFIAGCSSAPPPQKDPYNQADSQKSDAKQAQDELSSEIDKNK
jgi:PBP1b-binding outer membrane lipoprotein LpoB